MAYNGGKIQIVASPYLSDDDIDAIKRGYAERNTVIEHAVLRQITGEQLDYFSMERLNLLASLIADGVMDIQIAYTEDKTGIGMYHEKMGLIEDANGNTVAFSGSMNESATAMSINYETIDVFRSCLLYTSFISFLKASISMMLTDWGTIESDAGAAPIITNARSFSLESIWRNNLKSGEIFL